MHPPIGSDDETHFNFDAWVRGSENRIGCGQRLWRLSLLALRASAGAGYVGEFRVMDRRLPNLLFPADKRFYT
jgi:hypothetical protein